MQIKINDVSGGWSPTTHTFYEICFEFFEIVFHVFEHIQPLVKFKFGPKKKTTKMTLHFLLKPVPKFEAMNNVFFQFGSKLSKTQSNMGFECRVGEDFWGFWTHLNFA